MPWIAEVHESAAEGRLKECYERVIELDESLTVAYLYKGGVCNRLEKHNEALQSYERALQSERKRVTS